MGDIRGAICGGVISESELKRAKDIMGYCMCLILPDKKFRKYKKLLRENKRKEAGEIVKKYAWSLI